jgi:hypothetical protein
LVMREATREEEKERAAPMEGEKKEEREGRR